MSFWRHYYHFVWTTKERQPFITPEIETPLYAYMRSKAGELDAYIYAIGGIEEHTHIVGTVPPKHSIAWFVKTIKGSSSHFVNYVLRPERYHFAWQRGYGSLTLGHTQRPIAIEYVEKQKEHHKGFTTKGWLERTSEYDEGPDDAENPYVNGSELAMLREEKVVYDVLGISPF
ncbi:MAG: IS200/IS605 family transposase [Chloroflexota bacterium]